jgi:hypothetical protein
MQVVAVYYLAQRGQNAQNKMLTSAIGAWVAFDAFDLVETLLTQPLMIIAGDEAGWLWHSQEPPRQGAGSEGAVPHQGRQPHGPLRWRGRLYRGEQAGAVLQG